MLDRFFAPSRTQSKPEIRAFMLSSGQELAVKVTRNERAKRLIMRLDGRDHALKITAPPHVPEREITRFLNQNQGWIEKQISERPKADAIRPGVKIPVRGKAHIIEHSGKLRGLVTPYHCEAGAVLSVSGDNKMIGRRIADYLKREAKAEIEPKALQMAGQIGQKVKSISYKDTRSRWGSCSSDRALSFSWRIMMAPPLVIDYLIAHEVAHLQEMNHGPKFWALCERLCPETKRAKAWLKKNGAALQSIPFS